MTGYWPERIDVPDTITDHHQEEHLARYRWAAERASGVILDAACGTGYGSVILAGRGQVIGVDQDEQTVREAAARLPSARFLAETVPPISLADDSVDTVVSFETVEHVEDDRGFVGELRRVLRPGGTLLISSPNRAVSSPNDQVPPNPFHVREYLLPDFAELVRSNGFAHVDVWYQRLMPQRLHEHVAYAMLGRWPTLCRPGARWDRLGHGAPEVLPWKPEAKMPRFWILACR